MESIIRIDEGIFSMDFLDHPVQLGVELKQVERRTKDVKSIRFRRPKRFDYLPRQRAFITVGHENEVKTKPLSFSRSPTEYFLEVTKRMTGHEFSNFAKESMTKSACNQAG